MYRLINTGVAPHGRPGANRHGRCCVLKTFRFPVLHQTRLMDTDPCLLLVDADYDTCDALCAALRSAGYAADFAYDPSSAVEQVRQRQYGLVLIAHWPPYLDAVALGRRIARLQHGAEAMMVFLADRLTDETAAAARKAGFAHVLSRSADPAMFLEASLNPLLAGRCRPVAA